MAALKDKRADGSEREYLRGLDVLFGGLASPNVAFIAGASLTIFAPPIDQELLGYDYVKAFTARTRCTSRWTRKLVVSGDAATDPFWRSPFFSSEGFAFSIDDQVSLVELAEPTEPCLRSTVSELMSAPLDLDNAAVWHLYYISNLPGGGIALLDKQHHALTDGEGSIRHLGEAMAREQGREPPIQYDVHRQKGRQQSLVQAALSFISTLWSIAVAIVLSIAIDWIYLPLIMPGARRSLVFPDGRQHNRHKQVAWSSPERMVDLAVVKDAKNALGVSLNDVVLACVTDAIESFLREKKALRDENFAYGLPTSLRMPGDSSLSNQLLYYVLLSPASDPTAISERARQIATWMGLQRRMRPLVKITAWAADTFVRAPWMIPKRLMERQLAKSHGGLSNVPGPTTGFWPGFQHTIHVFNPISNSAPGALGVAVLSSAGKFSVAVMMERDDALPEFSEGSADRIVELFENAVARMGEEVRGLKKERLGSKKDL